MSKVNEIILLRDAITATDDIKCTCSDFSLQYEQGCTCDRGKAFDRAEKEFWDYIKNLRDDPKSMEDNT